MVDWGANIVRMLMSYHDATISNFAKQNQQNRERKKKFSIYPSRIDIYSVHVSITKLRFQVLCIEKEHSKNKCWEVSGLHGQRLQIEGNWQTLSIKLSSIWSLLCRSLHIIRLRRGNKDSDLLVIDEQNLPKSKHSRRRVLPNIFCI